MSSLPKINLEQVRMVLAEAGYDERVRNLVSLLNDDTLVRYPPEVTLADAWKVADICGYATCCWPCAQDQAGLDFAWAIGPCEHRGAEFLEETG